MELDNCLELSDEQFRKLPNSQKLDVLYINVRSIAGIKRVQKMQWVSIVGIASAISWLFIEFWKHIGG